MYYHKYFNSVHFKDWEKETDPRFSSLKLKKIKNIKLSDLIFKYVTAFSLNNFIHHVIFEI